MVQHKQAFTLIELLVVVLIIGILAAVAVPQYQKAVAKARYIQLMTVGAYVRRAEEAYYLANGEYTSDITALDIDVQETDFTLHLWKKNNTFAIWIDHKKNGLSYVDYGPRTLNGRRCRVYGNQPNWVYHVCQSLKGSSNYTTNTADGYREYTFE